MYCVLLAEDHESLRVELTEVLNDEGYLVYPAENVKDAVCIFRTKQIDLCILDVSLPDGDGYSLCKKIRNCSDVPILFLTAFNEEKQIIKGLEMGADDYLGKPFRLGELLARMKVRLKGRKSCVQSEEIYTSGDLTLDAKRYKAVGKEGEIGLSPIELSLCLCLVTAKGLVVGRERLMDIIGDSQGNFVEDNTLTVYLSRLKKKLGVFQNKSYIETVRGYGYCWSVAVYKKEE